MSESADSWENEFRWRSGRSNLALLVHEIKAWENTTKPKSFAKKLLIKKFTTIFGTDHIDVTTMQVKTFWHQCVTAWKNTVN